MRGRRLEEGRLKDGHNSKGGGIKVREERRRYEKWETKGREIKGRRLEEEGQRKKTKGWEGRLEKGKR